MSGSDLQARGGRVFDVVALLTAVLMGPIAVGQAAPAAPQAAPPTTAPAAAAAALPGPKAVALAFAGFIEKGDAAGAKGLLPADDPHGKFVDAAIGLSAALKRLDAAAVARFGESGRSVGQYDLHLADVAKALDQAQEKIDGDVATLTLQGNAPPVRLKKVGGKWLLQVAGSAEELRAQTLLATRLARAADRTAQEIAEGRYETPARAAQVLAARVLEVRMGL